MKYVLLIILTASISVSSFSQEANPYREDAKKVTTNLAKRYDLDKNQEAKMLKIQERKLNNMADIQVYRNNDQMMYYRKKKSIQNGTDASIMRLLNKQQLEIYKKDKADLRTRRANQSKLLREQGISGFELEKALIDIE